LSRTFGGLPLSRSSCSISNEFFFTARCSGHLPRWSPRSYLTPGNESKISTISLSFRDTARLSGVRKAKKELLCQCVKNSVLDIQIDRPLAADRPQDPRVPSLDGDVQDSFALSILVVDVDARHPQQLDNALVSVRSCGGAQGNGSLAIQAKALVVKQNPQTVGKPAIGGADDQLLRLPGIESRAGESQEEEK
jgi:hypothetical protein